MNLSVTTVVFAIVGSVGALDPTNQAIVDGVEKYCAEVPEDLGLSSRFPTFLQDIVGPTNYLEEPLFDPDCTSVSACFDKYKSDWINQGLKLAVPLMFAVISLILWMLFGCCACCRCCRRCPIWCCCREKRFPSYFSKCSLLFIWMSVAFFFVAIIIDTAFSAAATYDMHRGSVAILCRSLSLAAGVLNGMSVPINETTVETFIGTVPLGDELLSLEETIKDGGQAITDIIATTENTVDLENAVARLSEYLSLTEEMLGDPETLNPGTGEYECVLCRACCDGGANSYVGQMKTVIQDSFATSLRDLRTQVADTLTGSGLTDTRNAIDQGYSVVSDMTKNIEENLGQYLIDNQDTIDKALKWLLMAVIILIVLALIPVVWIIISLVHGVCKSYKISYSDPDDGPSNPRCVSTGWSLSLLYTFLILVIGGVLLIMGYVQASVCDSASDTDVFVDKVLDRFAPEVADSDSSRIAVNACLKSSGDGEFLAAIQVGSQTAEYYLNEVLTIESLVDKAFNEIPAIPEITETNEFKVLIDSMDAYRALYMIPAARIEALRTDVTFNAHTMTTDQTEKGYGSSAACASANYDLTKTALGQSIQASLIAAGYTLPISLINVAVTGVDAFIAAVQSEAQVVITGTCPNFSVTKDAYNPFTSLLFWQSQVSSKTNFKCDTITETTDPDTGVITFSRVGGTCASLAALDTYIVNLKNELTNAATLVDSTAPTTKTTIEDSILTILNEQVIPPVQAVLDGADCGPINNGWNALYNTFCYDYSYGIVGLGITFSVFGGLALVAVLIMFGIWRNLKDNLSLWKDLVNERSQRQANAVVAATPGPMGVQIIPSSPRANKRR